MNLKQKETAIVDQIEDENDNRFSSVAIPTKFSRWIIWKRMDKMPTKVLHNRNVLSCSRLADGINNLPAGQNAPMSQMQVGVCAVR